ncbi:hypothetical protein MW887_008225 [Aspergillus wentii]|nr:hypothetical protein MW887_008225 [Aspergillus wentii]
MAAWLATLCAVDDILELMPLDAAQASLERTIERDKSLCVGHDQVGFILNAFRDHCGSQLSPTVADSLMQAVYGVFQGLIDEFSFRQGHLPNTLETYMGIRNRTIGLDPFFVLIRSIFHPSEYLDELALLQKTVCTVNGLQNDLVGLDKDLKEGELMNAVVVLQGQDHQALLDTTQTVCLMHNKHILDAMDISQQLQMKMKDQNGAMFASILLAFTETHFKWCTLAKRYQVNLQ